MTEPLIIYHGNCPDGFTAAWVTQRALKCGELYAAKYGEDPPYEAAKDRDVYIVDFSYPRLILQELHGLTRSLLVLDHHKSAEADLAGLSYCKFDMNRSGAGLVWDHFHPDEPRPWLVNYVEDRDLWRFKLADSEEISLRIRLTPHVLEAFDDLATRAIEPVTVEGIGGLLYLKHYVRNEVRNAYDIPELFGDLTCRCINVSYTAVSDVLHEALQLGGVEIALGWHISKEGAVHCSLRSTKNVDCSEVAKLYGGGGHATASGFKTYPDSALALRLFRRAG